MTLAVVWMREATQDLIDAREWYAAIRPELGQRFAQAVTTTVVTIAEDPERFATIYRGLRRAGVRRFPYGLIFELKSKVRNAEFWCWHVFMADEIRSIGNRGFPGDSGFGW